MIRTGLLLNAIALLLLGGAAPAPPAPAPASAPVSLIYAGWFGNTIPTPDYVRDHQAFLETQPFSGLAIYLRDAGLTVNASTQVMTDTPISYAQISFVLAPLQGLTFTKLTRNFGLVFGNDPPDFFDDWTIPLQNFSNLALAVKDAGLKGIFFDNEQYFASWGDYPSGVLYPGKSLAEYQAQARWRGRQVMEAMVAQFPEIVVLTLHGPYISEPKAPSPLFPQWQSANELLGPFFAGFMEGKGPLSQNVDGGELYDLRSTDQFADSYAWRKNDLASDAVDCAFLPTADRPSWPSKISIGFGLYDQPFAGADMNPSIMKTTLLRALQQADQWVWLYVEGPTFLKPSSEGGASQVWIDAVQQAYAESGSGGSGGNPPQDEVPSSADSSGSSSSCGLLGGEAVLMVLTLLFFRRRQLKS